MLCLPVAAWALIRYLQYLLGYFFFKIEVLIFVDCDLSISSLINQQETKSWKKAEDCSENERKHKNSFPNRWPLKWMGNWDYPCSEVSYHKNTVSENKQEGSYCALRCTQRTSIDSNQSQMPKSYGRI